ncbi:MAG: peptidoglycan editing factor PgeF [Clostridia bacterium]|nr:peptidoglycan editing factor PgeF [Clostridia bacterium]
MVTLHCKALDDAGFEKHCFTTRCGGVSEGFLSSMNLSFSRECRENVEENYRRIQNAVGFSGNFALTNQEHTDVVRIIESGEGFVISETPVDGFVTDKKDICLTVFVADCVPVLIADPVNRVVSAVHSGWRGTAKRITENAVSVMTKSYGSRPEDLIAAIGPCIGKCCYEVGRDVFDGFSDPRFFDEKENGKFMLDLPTANKSVLIGAGLLPSNIYVSYECTFCKSDLYYSHRATNGKRGNLAAMIEL